MDGSDCRKALLDIHVVKPAYVALLQEVMFETQCSQEVLRAPKILSLIRGHECLRPLDTPK